MALGSAEIQRVIAVFEIGHYGPGRMHDPRDAMRAVAAMQSAAGHAHVGRAESLREGVELGRGGEHRCGALQKQFARILGANTLEHRRDFVERLVPADLLPAGVLVKALFGIGAAQRLGQPMGIVMAHDPGDTLAAQAPPADSTRGIAFDLDHRPVDAVREDRAGTVAKRAGRGNPGIVARLANTRR